MTNFARVVITPRTVRVTADDQEKASGDPDPEFTVTTAVEADEPPLTAEARARIDAVIAETQFSADRADKGEALGEYEIMPTGPATLDGGNFNVVYEPGVLTVYPPQTVVSLWITDHADAGAGRVHLAFKPTLSYGELSAAFVRKLAEEGRIQAVCGVTEAALADATPEVVPLRDETAQLDLDKGWIWVTIDLPADVAGLHVWKIVIAE